MVSTGDLSVDTADVVTLAGRTEAVSDAVSEGISALNAAPSSDGFGMIVGAIIGPVLGMFATSAHDLLAAAGTHASVTGGALRGAAASFEETESDSANSVRTWMP